MPTRGAGRHAELVIVSARPVVRDGRRTSPAARAERHLGVPGRVGLQMTADMYLRTLATEPAQGAPTR